MTAPHAPTPGPHGPNPAASPGLLKKIKDKIKLGVVLLLWGGVGTTGALTGDAVFFKKSREYKESISELEQSANTAIHNGIPLDSVQELISKLRSASEETARKNRGQASDLQDLSEKIDLTNTEVVVKKHTLEQILPEVTDISSSAVKNIGKLTEESIKSLQESLQELREQIKNDPEGTYGFWRFFSEGWKQRFQRANISTDDLTSLIAKISDCEKLLENASTLPPFFQEKLALIMEVDKPSADPYDFTRQAEEAIRALHDKGHFFMDSGVYGIAILLAWRAFRRLKKKNNTHAIHDEPELADKQQRQRAIATVDIWLGELTKINSHLGGLNTSFINISQQIELIEKNNKYISRLKKLDQKTKGSRWHYRNWSFGNRQRKFESHLQSIRSNTTKFQKLLEYNTLKSEKIDAESMIHMVEQFPSTDIKSKLTEIKAKLCDDHLTEEGFDTLKNELDDLIGRIGNFIQSNNL